MYHITTSNLCQKKIGKGSFGTVYEGINTKNNDKIAFKLEKREKGKSGTLETEAYRLLYLQGEGVPKIYCYGNNSSYNILIQELLGDSLDTLFTKHSKKFSLKTVCMLGLQMISVLEYIHNRHIVHRDIKSDNIVVNKEGQCKICDFGMARKIGKEGDKFTSCQGNIYFYPPEFCDGKDTKYYQLKPVDVWAFGIILYYMISYNNFYYKKKYLVFYQEMFLLL